MTQRSDAIYKWNLRKAYDPSGLARTHKTAHGAVLVGQYIYIFGGQDHVHKTSEQKWLVLDFVRERWKSIRVSRELRGLFRSAHTATLVEDKILLIGGYSRSPDDRLLNTNFRSDTTQIVFMDLVLKETKLVMTRGDSPGVLAYHIAEFVSVRGTVVVYGGDVDEPIVPLAYPLYEYSPERRTWSKLRWKGTAPPIRSNHASAVFMTDMYIFGGITEHSVYGDLHILRCAPQVPSWSSPNVSGELPSSRFSPILATFKNRLLLYGGRAGLPGERLNDVHEYNPSTGKWTLILPRGVTPPAKSNHKAVVLKNSLIILGGMESPLRDVMELKLRN